MINNSASKDRCSAPGAEASEPLTAACFVTLCPELAQCNIAGCSSSPNKLTGAKHKNVRQNKQHNTLLGGQHHTYCATAYSVRDKQGGRDRHHCARPTYWWSCGAFQQSNPGHRMIGRDNGRNSCSPHGKARYLKKAQKLVAATAAILNCALFFLLVQ